MILFTIYNTLCLSLCVIYTLNLTTTLQARESTDAQPFRKYQAPTRDLGKAPSKKDRENIFQMWQDELNSASLLLAHLPSDVQPTIRHQLDPTRGLRKVPPKKDHEELFQKWQDKLNLNIELGYTLILQGASRFNDRSPVLLSGSYDLVGEWGMIPDGAIGFALGGGQIISHNRHEDLSANIGSNMGINTDWDNHDATVSELFYTHTFVNDTFVITLGKINQASFFDSNTLANDETAQFLAGPLVNNTSIPFPDNGLGVNLLVNFSENLYLTGGLGASHTNTQASSFTTFTRGSFFYVAEMGYINTDDLSGNYRVTFWHNQHLTDEGCGIDFSVDQHLTPNLVLFGRWGLGDEKVTDFQQFFSAGIGIEAPWGRQEDLTAIGIAWAAPSDSTVKEETIIEAFYRYQLNDLMALTPSIQAIINPAAMPEADTTYVFSLRLQTTW